MNQFYRLAFTTFSLFMGLCAYAQTGLIKSHHNNNQLASNNLLTGYATSTSEENAATETKSVRTLSFPDGNCEENASTGGHYNTTWTAMTQDKAYSWTMKDINNYSWGNDWTFVRLGAKKTTASTPTITTDQPIAQSIASVVINISKFTQPETITALTLEVATDADFTQNVQTVNMDADKYVPGYMVFNVPTPTENAYYRITFTSKGNGTKSNGNVEIKRVSYYHDAFETVNIKNTAETAYTIDEAKNLYDAGEGLLDSVYVKGKIVVVDTTDNVKRPNITISEDGTTNTHTLEAYYGLYLNKTEYTSDIVINEMMQGKEVLFYGTLAKYKGTYQLGTGSILISINNATGIKAANTDATRTIDRKLYNLAGQRVDEGYKGIVICNGRKWIKK